MSMPPDPSQDPYQSPYSDGFQPPAWQVPEEKHSGLGIASFILAFVSGIGVFITIVVAGVLETSTPGGLDEQAPETIAVGFGIIGFAGLSLLGAGLGVAGMLQPKRKKILAVLGTVLNVLVILGFCGIMALGLAVQGGI